MHEKVVLFHFRKRCTGDKSTFPTYTQSKRQTGNRIHPNEFEKWEAVEFLNSRLSGRSCPMLHTTRTDGVPSNCKQGRKQTSCNMKSNWLSETDSGKKSRTSMSVHTIAKFRLAGQSLRCASPMVTGPAKFNCQRNNKALDAYQNRFDEFHDWRNRFKAAMERMKEAAKPEEQKQEEAWNRLKRDIASSAQTIHDIDTGKARGYSRALFVSSILNKVSTYAGKGRSGNRTESGGLHYRLQCAMQKTGYHSSNVSSNCRKWHARPD